MTKRNVFRARLLLACIGFAALTACGSDDGPDTPDLEARLLADTGVRWIVDRDDASRPLFLTAPVDAPPPIAASQPRDRAAIEFLQRYADAFGAGTLADELTLVRDDEDPVARGVHHLRFAQRIPGTNVRAFGADTFAHFDANGSLRFAAIGLVVDMAKISPHPARSADEARNAAEASVRAEDAQAKIAMPKPPELVVHRAADGKGTLSWRVVLTALVSGSLRAPEVFVDASNLAIIASNDTAAHATKRTSAPNFYFYHDDCKRAGHAKDSVIDYDDAYAGPFAPSVLTNPAGVTNRLYREGDATKSTIITDQFLAGDVATETFFTQPTLTSDPRMWDLLPAGHQGSGAAVSTHENLTMTDAYFRKLGQRGWDDILPGGAVAPNPIRAAVHAFELRPAAEKGGIAGITDFNAYFNGVIYLGDGISNASDPLGTSNCDVYPGGVALDVVGHEFTHGVVDFTAKLGSAGDAGAMNEAFADVLGAGVEHSVHPGDRNWVIAEDTFVASGGIRSMRSPRSFPTRVKGEKVPRAASEKLDSVDRADDNDHGHVHDNSLILSHAYFLMTEGGRNEKSGFVVPAGVALGWDRSQLLWYLSLLALDRRSATKFRDLARVNTNLSIFFADVRAVACAWRAVEVFTDADVKGYGVSCQAEAATTTTTPPPQPPPPARANFCDGHGDALVCNPEAAFMAIQCKNGFPAGDVACADLATKCKSVSTVDLTAVTDDNGIVCE